MRRAIALSGLPAAALTIAAPRLTRALLVLLLGMAALAHSPADAQDVLDRSPNLSGGWIGVPWTVHVQMPTRFRDADPGTGIDLLPTTTFTGALGLPYRSVAAVSYAPLSPTAPGEPDEVEILARHRLLSAGQDPIDLALTAAWNSAAGSLDAEAAVARRLGPVRALGAARWFADARGSGDARFALAAGAVWHPLPRTAPLAVAADLAVPLERDPGEDPAWSASVQAGIPHTALTVSLLATNTAAATLQGATFADAPTRWGFELTLPIPAGYFFGAYPSREEAMAAVAVEAQPDAGTVVEIRRYAYGPQRVVVDAGTVVEWVNRDDVVHTATAEDAAWDSGAIRPGASWRARFDEPGIYPYYCGPHPFMKGVVIVR